MHSIQKTSQATGVSAHTLRYYERIGLLRPIARDASGYRLYSDDDIGWVRFLLCLRNTGMSIQKIQTYLRLEREGDASNDDRCGLLAHHRQDVLERVEALQQNLKAIDEKIAYYQSLKEDV